MTSSITDICNRALSAIGTQSFIASLAEQSPEAVNCALWYDNTRTSLLRAAPWAFARKQLFLTLLGKFSDGTSPYPWIFKYAYPEDCLKFRYIVQPPFPIEGAISPPQVGVGPIGPTWLRPSRQWRFLINSDIDENGNEVKTILSNVCNAIGVYTRDSDNPDMFDSQFDSALTAALAHKLVIPLSGNVGMRDGFEKSAEKSVLNAMVSNANESITSSDVQVDWIAARSVGAYGALNGYGSPGIEWGQCCSNYDSLNWSM